MSDDWQEHEDSTTGDEWKIPKGKKFGNVDAVYSPKTYLSTLGWTLYVGVFQRDGIPVFEIWMIPAGSSLEVEHWTKLFSRRLDEPLG